MTTAANKVRNVSSAKKAAATKKAASAKKVLPHKSSTTINPSVGVRELRQSASKILDQVKEGAIIEITEHGVPIARLVPITKSLYEEYIEAGLIIPAKNPTTHFDMPTFQLKGKKTSTQILMEMRAEARY